MALRWTNSDGWYPGSDYYITGKTNGIKYIATLQGLIEGDEGRIKVFNNVRNANTKKVVTEGDHVKKGIFKYQFLDNNDWVLSEPITESARQRSMGFGGSKRRRRTRKSRKVKRRRTGRRRY